MGLSYLTFAIHDVTIIHAINACTGSCLDSHLDMVFLYTTLAVANSMWSTVHPEQLCIYDNCGHANKLNIIYYNLSVITMSLN
jgi:hypothetical protein